MKTLFKWLPWVLVVMLSTVYFFIIRHHNSPEPADTSSNENEIKAIHSTRDSLTQVIEAKTDTIQALRGRAESAEFQAMKERKQNNQLRKDYAKITFVTYASDSARLTEWSRDFPSLRRGRFGAIPN